MTTILHIDASARSGRSDQVQFGSHTRRLTAQFLERWRLFRPKDEVIYRDVGLAPPAPVTGRWIHAAFTKSDQRESWMDEVLSQSDELVDELLSADLIVAGVPMYNFGPPAQFKAYIDNIVRADRTFGFDRSRRGDPYWPLLANMGKQMVLISSRGDYGYDDRSRNSVQNHVEPSIRTAFEYIGVTEFHTVAVEYDEFADDRLAASLVRAEDAVMNLIDKLTITLEAVRDDRRIA